MWWMSHPWEHMRSGGRALSTDGAVLSMFVAGEWEQTAFKGPSPLK